MLLAARLHSIGTWEMTAKLKQKGCVKKQQIHATQNVGWHWVASDRSADHAALLYR